MLGSHEEKLCRGISDWLPQCEVEQKKAVMEEIQQRLKQGRRISKSGATGVLAEAYSERQKLFEEGRTWTSW